MGFFSFVGKALGKVAKAGLSVVTHGVSDKVLSAAKSLGTAKQMATSAAGNLQTLKQQVAIQKATQAPAGANPVGSQTAKAVLKKITSTAPPAKKFSAAQKKALKYRPKIVKAKKPKRRDVGTGRKPPKGGLDLARMAADWRAAGKPGKWIDWVKSPSHQIRKG